MHRNLGEEIDQLRAEMRGLAEVVAELRGRGRAPTYESGKLDLALDLEQKAKASGISGLITYAGWYSSGGCGYRWETVGRHAEELLAQDDERVARALSALANKQRLALLKAILAKPSSAAELVDQLGMGTTGQVYHHLKALQAADLIVQEERGIFAFKGHRAQSLLVLLAGVYDMLDTRHSAGEWDSEQ